jgi:serine-type D-Ala-D-Ala carboxypeptidase/endopeptidase (penicillin-binding protein 4)
MISLFLFHQSTLQSALDRVWDDAKLAGAVVSATVTDGDGNVLYGRNSKTHVMPASNMKLLSSAFALHHKGPEWRPRTKFWKTGTALIVESEGDPLLSYKNLTELKKSLGLDGRSTVRVKQAYNVGFLGNWEIGDLPNRYAAPVSAFEFDQAAFEVWSKRGKPVFVPERFGIQVIFDRQLAEPFRYDPIRREFRYSAKFPTKDGLVDTLSLPAGDKAAALVLGRGLERVDSVPASEPTTVFVGRPLIEVLAACLPVSDNQMAEQLFLLGGRAEGAFESDPYGETQKRETNFLVRTVGVDRADLRIDDGSGLSRHNFVTSAALAKLLAWSLKQPTATQWKEVLAHPGKATLATRLKGITFAGKTGSLDMVAALSGYVETASHKTRIVSFILNEYGCTAHEARDLIDKAVEIVAKD